MSVSASTTVRKLTAAGTRRHEFDAVRAVFGIALVLASFGACAAANTGPGAWHPTAEIAATAEDYLRGLMGPQATRTTVQAGTLDPRHRLARCSKPLEPYLRRGSRIAARTVVGVRCSGEKPWKLFVPVDVVVTENVLVARRTLPRGHLLVADDLAVEQRDVSRLLTGYVSDPKEFLGQRLKSQLIAGRMLTPTMLQADIAVRRGQSVTLSISTGGIDVEMSGKARMDGAIGQRIRVENINSGRIVEGIVRSREHVEVLSPSGR